MSEHEPSQHSNWSWPVSVRIGAVGLGVGVGCGVGVGVGSPLNLGAIPAVGQVAQGISTGLAALPGPLAGLGMEARRKLLSLGVKGLDAGLGCGVGIGYGFGAGLMLKPSAAEELVTGLQSLAGRAVHLVQGRLSKHGLLPPQSPAETLNSGQLPSNFPAASGQLPPSSADMQSRPALEAASPGSPADVLQQVMGSFQPGSGQGPQSLLAGTGLLGSAGQGLGLGALHSPRAGLGFVGPQLPAASGVAGRAAPSHLGGVLQAPSVEGGVLGTLLATQQVVAVMVSQQQQLEVLGRHVGVLEGKVGELGARLEAQEKEGEALREVLSHLCEATPEQEWCEVQRREGRQGVVAGRAGGKGAKAKGKVAGGEQ